MKKYNTVLENLMFEANVERKELMIGTGLNYFSLAKYIDGTRSITKENAEKIAKYFSTRLQREINPESLISGKDAAATMVKVPIYLYDSNKQSIADLLGYETISIENLPQGDYFYLQVPKFNMLLPFPITRLLCIRQTHAKNGDIVILTFNGKTLIRSFIQAEEHIFLHPITHEVSAITTKKDKISIMGCCVRIENTINEENGSYSE